MHFLCSEKLGDRAVTLDGKAYSTNRVMRRCYNGFGRSAPCKSYLPFNKFKSTITDSNIAREPLSVDHHKLHFEDFVELMPGTEVTLLISQMNHFFQDKNTKKFFEAELHSNPLIPRVISGKCYFAFKVVIESNPKCNDFIDSNLTQLEIANLCCFHEGVTIWLQLKHSKHLLNFFHFDFFQSIDTI